MTTLSKYLALAGLLSLAAVGCASTQEHTEVAAHGTSRTDATHHRADQAPVKGHEFWQKMR